MLRSTHAHARIVSIDATAALKMPGVLLVLTGADVLAEGLQPIPHIPQAMSPPDIRLDNLDGSPHLLERPMILATDSVRFVGEGVAFVVAETVAQAKDAAEAIEVVYETLPPMDDIAVDARVGNPQATRAGFAEAEYVVRLETDIQRIAGVPMEPRAALGRLRSGDRPLHALCRRRRGGAAEEGAGDHPRPRAGAGPRHRPGDRRQLRHPQFPLSRVRAGRLGGEEGRPAGQMDLRTRRGLRQRLCRAATCGSNRSWRYRPTASSSACMRPRPATSAPTPPRTSR